MNRYEMDKERENFRTILKKMFSITEDAASNEEIRDRILSGGKITGTNMVVMICAILIASVGLNTNSIGGHHWCNADFSADGQHFGNFLRNSFQ